MICCPSALTAPTTTMKKMKMVTLSPHRTGPSSWRTRMCSRKAVSPFIDNRTRLPSKRTSRAWSHISPWHSQNPPTGLYPLDLFLLDSLSLPRHIVPRDSREEVSNAVLFDNAASAINYCTERLERGWKDTRPAADPTERASRRHTHPKVNKWELFRRHSARLTEALTSGQAPFDANLNRVRMDRNVA